MATWYTFATAHYEVTTDLASQLLSSFMRLIYKDLWGGAIPGTPIDLWLVLWLDIEAYAWDRFANVCVKLWFSTLKVSLWYLAFICCCCYCCMLLLLLSQVVPAVHIVIVVLLFSILSSILSFFINIPHLYPFSTSIFRRACWWMQLHFQMVC